MAKVDMGGPCVLVFHGLIEKTGNAKEIINGIWIKLPNTNTRETEI